MTIPVPDEVLDSVEYIASAISRGDAASLAVLRPLLEQARPGAGWVDEELDAGVLPTGEWWITDPVEGAINRVHGLTEWAVTFGEPRSDRPSRGSHRAQHRSAAAPDCHYTCNDLGTFRMGHPAPWADATGRCLAIGKS